MDLGIKELGVTLIVGAFTILGFDSILYYFFGRQFTHFFPIKLDFVLGERGKHSKADDTSEAQNQDREEKRNDHPMKIAIFIGFAFAVGILAEDLSYKYVDSVETPFKYIPAKISSILPTDFRRNLGLPSKDDARVTTLIKNFKGQPEVEQLAVDLATDKAFSLSDPKSGKVVEEWILNEQRCAPQTVRTNDCPSYSEITTSITRLYYYAKNRTYEIPEYYDEMKRIQTRVDFERSISLFAFIYFAFAGLATLLIAIQWLNAKRTEGKNRHAGKARFENRPFSCGGLVLYLFS